MNIDEQDRIRGRAMREKEEAETELRCWHDTVQRMGRSASYLGTTLKNIGHEQAAPILTDDVQAHLNSWPTKEDIETACQEIHRLSEEIQRLEGVIG